MDVDIRPACPEDRGYILGLVSSFVEFGLPPWRDAALLTPRFSEALGRAAGGEDLGDTVLIAQAEDGRRLGFIRLTSVPDLSGGARAHVADLAVSSDARRSGVGTALMAAAEGWACERGFDLLSLEVWSTNEAALAFYRRLGYGVDSLSLVKPLD